MLSRFLGIGFNYVINPVSSFRYFEFPFALSSLPDKPGCCLDVSSPSLFSFYVAEYRHPESIWMINPDKQDLDQSTKIVNKLNIRNIRADCSTVDILSSTSKTFDTIWSISVVEHVSGDYDDIYAIRLMYNALAVGGRLIITVPVDRRFWTEYRKEAYYGIPEEVSDPRGYFFQRYYNKDAIWERLVAAIGNEPSSIRWFGEKNVGYFSEYEKRWLKEGIKCTVDDPLEMSEKYQEFPSWESMPGMGVCGLTFIKKPD